MNRRGRHGAVISCMLAACSFEAPGPRPGVGDGLDAGRPAQDTGAWPLLDAGFGLDAGTSDGLIQEEDARSADAEPGADGAPARDGGAGPDATSGLDGAMALDASTPASWRVRVSSPAAVLRPSVDGCLLPSADVLPLGTELEALAEDTLFVLIDEDGSCLHLSDVVEVERPDPIPPSTRTGTVANGTTLYRYDSTGCPTAQGDLPEGTAVEALAKSHDGNFRGFAVIGRDLTLAPLRMIYTPEWIFPWHAAVQLVKEVPTGFVIGGGVIVGPSAILTAAHLQVDQAYCYSRELNSGVAWAAGRFTCANVATVEPHPDGVDLSIVHLIAPEAPPFASVRQTEVLLGSEFYTTRFSTLHTHAFSDSTVSEVGNRNAGCDSWPAASSFVAADEIVGGGDSGGPAFVGDELVGLVHGEACRWPWQSAEHVFVHLPGLLPFIQPVLP